jgi:hypothetical protein
MTGRIILQPVEEVYSQCEKSFLFSWFAACLVWPVVSNAQTADEFAEIFYAST